MKTEEYFKLQQIEFQNANIESLISRNTIYFSTKIQTTIRKTANDKAKSTCMYKCICKVNKKEQQKVFYLKVCKIDSVFFA